MRNSASRFLKIHGIILLLAGSSMAIQTLLAHTAGIGMLKILHGNLFACIGFFEAYLLAALLGALLLFFSGKYYQRQWHMVAAFVHTILACTNIIFWHAYAMGNIVAAGYISTAMHFVFIISESFLFIRTQKEQNNKPIK